jgi:hypothetical protein
VLGGVLCIHAFWRVADVMGLRTTAASRTELCRLHVAVRANDRMGRSTADMMTIEDNRKGKNEGGVDYLLYNGSAVRVRVNI